MSLSEGLKLRRVGMIAAREARCKVRERVHCTRQELLGGYCCVKGYRPLVFLLGVLLAGLLAGFLVARFVDFFAGFRAVIGFGRA
jgi:hypothetical protein